VNLFLPRRHHQWSRFPGRADSAPCASLCI